MTTKMDPKPLVFVLLPSFLFTVVAIVLLYYAPRGFSLDENYKLKTEKRIAELTRNVQTGEVGKTPDELVEMIGNSWRRRDELQESLAKAHIQISRIAAGTILAGVMLQIYVCFRVKVSARPTARQMPPA